MFSVSNDYLTAIRSNVRRTKIRGFVDNVTVFTESNIEADSFVINESFLGSDLSIGNTQSADMSVNVVGESSIAIGDEITVEWGIQIHSEPVQYEWVPLGVFVVDNIEKVGSVSKISAFDKMVYFEKDIDLPDTQSRTPYNWLIYACQECGVTFGMTAEEVNALPNYAAYGVPIDDKLRTYRNLISQLCIIAGCNAVINRSGELVLIPLEIKEPVYNITNNEIVFDTLMVEDYTVQITGVFFVAPSGNRYGIISGNGKKIEISDLPMIEDQTETSYTNISRQIVHLIKYYSYTPFNTEWIGNPALDLGDWITINNSTTVITGRTIKFGNVEKLEAVGTLNETKISDSKTPTENAVDILRIKSLLNSTYATKEEMLKHLLDGSAEGSLRLSSAVAEDSNYTIGRDCISLGYYSKAYGGNFNSVFGGEYDVVYGYANSILGGDNNLINMQNESTYYSIIAGGQYNRIYGGNSNGIFSSSNSQIQRGYYNGIISGNNNNIDGGYSNGIIGGQSNRISKDDNAYEYPFNATLLGGSNNRIYNYGYSSCILDGANNRIYNSGMSVIAGGNYNYINGGYNNFISGEGNEILLDSNIQDTYSEENAALGGVNKIVNSQKTFLGGYYNQIIISQAAAGFGNTNRAIKADSSFFSGYGNQIGYYTLFSDATVVRAGNTVNVVLNTAPTEYTYGRKIAFFNGSALIDVFDLYWQAGSTTSNTITLNTTALQNYTNVYEFFPSRYSGVFGYYNIANNDNQLISGSFNQPNRDALFQIGNGTNENNRSNAFEVLQDGTLKAGGQKVPRKFIITLGDNSAITKSENLEILYNFMDGDYEYDLLWACYYDTNDDPIFVPLTACHLFRSNDMYVFSHYDVDNTKWCTYKVTMNADYTDYTETYIEH